MTYPVVTLTIKITLKKRNELWTKAWLRFISFLGVPRLITAVPENIQQRSNKLMMDTHTVSVI
jgi:hypothetical protein